MSVVEIENQLGNLHVIQDENASRSVWDDHIRPYQSFLSVLEDLSEPLEADILLIDPKELVQSVTKEVDLWIEMLTQARDEKEARGNV